MRALSLVQPWASLVAFGEKRIESRSWGTAYRGPMAIHAAKGLSRDDRDFAATDPAIQEALARHGATLDDLPRGAVIATARLIDVLSTNGPAVDLALDSGEYPPDEEAFGDYGPDRFAWLLVDVTALPVPVAAKGSLGLWEWVQP